MPIINAFVALLMDCGLQNDETLSSTWRRHEIETARLHAIPIIVVIDSDHRSAIAASGDQRLPAKGIRLALRRTDC